MIGARAFGLLCNDPQRGALAFHAVQQLVGLPDDADAIGLGTVVDGNALLSRLPSVQGSVQGSVAQLVGPLRGRASIVQVGARRELRPASHDHAAQVGPFRARNWIGAVVGGAGDADRASTNRARLLQDVPEFLVRGLAGSSEAEAFFVAVLARLHASGRLDALPYRGAAIAEAIADVDARAPAAARHVVISNGVEVVSWSRAMPSALVLWNGIPEDVAAAVDPTLVDSSTARERLRRFRGAMVIGALDDAVPVGTSVAQGALIRPFVEDTCIVLQRDLTPRTLEPRSLGTRA